MKRLATPSNLIALAMALAALLAWQLQPQPIAREAVPSLADVVPVQFGGWKELKGVLPPVDPRSQMTGDVDATNPYDDVLMRAYANADGDVVLLALAYGHHQKQEVKIHRPELCYVSQGFRMVSKTPTVFPLAARDAGGVGGTRMLVSSPSRIEAVSYWIRIGDIYSSNAWQTRFYLLSEGLKGKAVDGMLVRVSQILPDEKSASADRYELQERFVADLVRAMAAPERRLLVAGGGNS